MRIVTLDETTKTNILSDLLKRDPNNYDSYAGTVQEIVDTVKEKKDEAVFAYTKKFDGADICADNIRVTDEEIKEAMAQVEPGLLDVMKKAMKMQEQQLLQLKIYILLMMEEFQLMEF